MTPALHVLIDSFLSDRSSSNPLGTRVPVWGRRVDNLADVDPAELSNSVVVIEPWEHVGERPNDHVGVKASENVAYLIDQILGLPTLIVPAWKTGVSDMKGFTALLGMAKLVVMEGGEPDVHLPETFTDAFPRSAATGLIQEFLLHQIPFIGICLSHQLTAQAHMELIRRILDSFRDSTIPAFLAAADRIEHMAEGLTVEKGYGTAAQTWTDDSFAVAKNEAVSQEETRLYPYQDVELAHVPTEITEAYRVVAKRHDAIIDVALQYETDLHIQAFHGNEVSRESMRFACWAYQQIHHVISAYPLEAAASPVLSPLMGAPIGVEILASTHTKEGHPLCEVAATGIYWEQGRSALTTQFHPELDHSLMTASEGWAPTWQELKESDGVRLFLRMVRSVL